MPRIEVSGEHDVLVRQLSALELGDHVELRHEPQLLGTGVDPEPRALAALRHAVEHPVVLTRDVERGDLAGPAVGDLVHAPAPGPVARKHAERAGAVK